MNLLVGPLLRVHILHVAEEERRLLNDGQSAGLPLPNVSGEVPVEDNGCSDDEGPEDRGHQRPGRLLQPSVRRQAAV